MWNADQGFGMVTHQNIGYLFPMGPYFWLTHTAHVPTWIAQRFWMGSLLFLAGLGIRKAAQELGLSRLAGWTAALPYVFTPFILVNIGRTSAILMPWAGLGWLLLFAIRSARFGGWKNPARFAIVVALVGGVNATSILLVGLAPLIWLIFAGLTKEVSIRAIVASIGRIGILCASVSLWWIAGLWAEGKFGINILQYTETIPTVASTSSSSEVFRGLGYWYFYGWDHSQAWTTASAGYLTGKVAPLFSLALPTAGFIAALLIRWRYRSFAVVTAFVGFVIAVGAYPYNSPTPTGSVLKWFGENTTVGLAMRSTNRVAPIIIMSLGLLLGAGIDAYRSRAPRRVLPVFLAILLSAVVALTPLFNGTALAKNLGSNQTLPSYVTEAANDLNRANTSSGVLGLPGLDFGYYRWGAFVDSAWPGLLHRPFVTSQITLQGQPASVNLVRALDSPVQDLIAQPQTIAPIARLLGTGDVLFQFDTQYERFSGPEPWYLWRLAKQTYESLTLKKVYGPAIKDQVPDGPFINESNLALPADFKWPPALAIYGVTGVRGLVRVESTSSPAIVGGDGEGLVNMAALGMLPESRAIFYDGSLSNSQFDQLTTQTSPVLYLTDTNQRRLNSYGVLHSSPGYVQVANEKPLVNNPSQQTLLAFPNTVRGAQTVAVLGNIRSIQASSYGNPIANNPEVQAYYAMDGSTDTAWQTAAFGKALGQFIQINLGRSVSFGRIHLTQPQSSTINRWITQVRVWIDGHDIGLFKLGAATRTRAGGDIRFPRVRGSVIRISVEKTTHDQDPLGGQSGIGFAEIRIPNVEPATHTLLLPTSLLSRAGNAALTSELHIVLTRARVATTPPRLDPELNLDRIFELPAGRTFQISGSGSIQPASSDAVLSSLLGIGTSSTGRISAATSSSRLVGSLTNGPWAAFDNNPLSSWMPAFQTGPNTWIEAKTPAMTTLHGFDVTFINDGQHMIPDVMTLVANDGAGGSFTFKTGLKLPATSKRGTTETLHFDTPALSGTSFRLSMNKFTSVTVKDRISGSTNHPPIAITELKLGELKPLKIAYDFSTGCRSDLLKIDGIPIPIQASSSTSQALVQHQIQFESCAKSPITLSAGTHHIQSTLGVKTGFNVDTLALSSPSAQPTPSPGAIANLVSHWSNRWTIEARVPKSAAGQFIAVGQSFGPGWTAKLDGVDLGAPLLIDGASLGWRLPSKMSGPQNFVVTWVPQKTVNLALIVSLLGLLLCLWLAIGRAPKTTQWIKDAHSHPLGSAEIRRPVLTLIVGMTASICVSMWLIPPMLVAIGYLFASSRAWVQLRRLTISLIVLGGICTVVATQMHLERSIQWPNHVPFANGLTWCALAMWLTFTVATTTPYERDLDATTPDPYAQERRRGLNVPQTPTPSSTDERELLPLVVAPRGLLRTFALLRALFVKRRDPNLYQRIIITDTMNQVVGNAPLFNRNVLEIADTDTSYADGFIERGARVTQMRREASTQRRGVTPTTNRTGEPSYTPASIPYPDKSFDLIFGTNIISSVEDPVTLLNELIRITRPGGTIYIQNVTWYSPWGGRETSPWHLLSGRFAKRRFTKRHGRAPVNSFGLNFFRMRIGETMRAFHDDPRIIVVYAGPRYLPESFAWILRLPVIRELLTINLAVRLERLPD